MKHVSVIVVYCSRIGFQGYKCSGPPACVSDLVEPVYRLYLLIKFLREDLSAFKQARGTQDYSGGSNTTVSCEMRGAEYATATNPQPPPDFFVCVCADQR